MASKIVVSVIIPTYNRLSYLKRCLSSLFSQDMDCRSFEVIVVDDGSSDGTLDYVLSLQKIKKGFNLRYFRQKNCGPAAARNLGARHSHGEFLAFLDDDCIAHKSWLLEIVRSFDRFPEASYIGGYTILVYKDLIRKNLTEWRRRWIKKNQDLSERLVPGPNSVENMIFTDNSAIKRSAFIKVNGFNPKLRYTEDNDLCLKLLNADHAVYRVNSVQVDHYQRESLWGMLRRHYRFGKLVVKNYKDHFKGYTSINVHTLVDYTSDDGKTRIEIGKFPYIAFKSGLTVCISRNFFKDILLILLLSFFWPIFGLILFLIRILAVYLFETQDIKATLGLCACRMIDEPSFWIGNIVGSLKNRIIRL